MAHKQFHFNCYNKRDFKIIIYDKFKNESLKTKKEEEIADLLIVTCAIRITQSAQKCKFILLVVEDTDLLITLRALTNTILKIFS